MEATRKNLEKLRDDRELVSIRRNTCRDAKVQAFIVDFSKQLVLLHHVYDFHMDGLMLFRVSDVTNIEVTKTDKFQRKLLLQEREMDAVDFDRRLPIQSYRAFLNSLPDGKVVILEDEIAEEREFIMGTLNYADENVASVRFLTGAANWLEEPAVIETERITCCQIESNYINYYQRYFARQKLKNKE